MFILILYFVYDVDSNNSQLKALTVNEAGQADVGRMLA